MGRGQMQLDECLTRCEAVSQTLADFSDACFDAEQAEEEAIANTTASKTFTCETMATLAGDRGGCINADGSWKVWCECGPL